MIFEELFDNTLSFYQCRWNTSDISEENCTMSDVVNAFCYYCIKCLTKKAILFFKTQQVSPNLILQIWHYVLFKIIRMMRSVLWIKFFVFGFTSTSFWVYKLMAFALPVRRRICFDCYYIMEILSIQVRSNIQLHNYRNPFLGVHTFLVILKQSVSLKNKVEQIL